MAYMVHVDMGIFMPMAAVFETRQEAVRYAAKALHRGAKVRIEGGEEDGSERKK